MIFYTDKLPIYNDWAAGVAIGPLIWIKNTHKENKGLLAHEKFHTKMFWIWAAPFTCVAIVLFLMQFVNLALITIGVALSLRALIYWYIDSYRLWEEVKAYIIQWKVNEEAEVRLQIYAKAIVKHYRLSISEEEVLEKLKNELKRSH